MWIIPSDTFQFAAATEALTLDCEQFCQHAEQSLTWRSKHTPARTWLQRWKRSCWMQRLSGQTYAPSTLDPFADTSTLYLEAFPASRIQRAAHEKQMQTHGTFSLTSNGLSQNANLLAFSLKTSRASSQQNLLELPKPRFSSMSWEDWKAAVTEQRGAYTARQKLERPTSETGSSFSRWPTPTVAEAGKISNRANNGQVGLSNHPSIQGKCKRMPLNKSRCGQPDQSRSNTITKSRGQLNPAWVEQLMGLPPGWTDCAC